jgi:hypothetical protein
VRNDGRTSEAPVRRRLRAQADDAVPVAPASTRPIHARISRCRCALERVGTALAERKDMTPHATSPTKKVDAPGNRSQPRARTDSAELPQTDVMRREAPRGRQADQEDKYFDVPCTD